MKWQLPSTIGYYKVAKKKKSRVNKIYLIKLQGTMNGGGGLTGMYSSNSNAYRKIYRSRPFFILLFKVARLAHQLW